MKDPPGVLPGGLLGALGRKDFQELIEIADLSRQASPALSGATMARLMFRRVPIMPALHLG